MMPNDTQQLIRRLAESAEPVRPLPRPWIRAAAWLGVSLPFLGLIILVMSPPGGPFWGLSDRRLVVEQVAALATGLTAAAAAFATIVPGYSRKIVMVPLVPLALWLGALGQGCIRDWIESGSHNWSVMEHWFCLPATILVGALPGFTMVMMLRRGAPLTPRLTTALGALAVGGLGNFGVRFVHAFDASVIVLAWHFGAVFVLSALAASSGRHLLNWRLLEGRYSGVA